MSFKKVNTGQCLAALATFNTWFLQNSQIFLLFLAAV